MLGDNLRSRHGGQKEDLCLQIDLRTRRRIPKLIIFSDRRSGAKWERLGLGKILESL